ncbi:hypothetical protein D3C72_1960340 [compost metagenome]
MVDAHALVGHEQARLRVIKQVLFTESRQVTACFAQALQQEGLFGRAVKGPEGLHVHFGGHADQFIGLALQLFFQQLQGQMGLLAQLGGLGHKAHRRIALAQRACAPALQRGDVNLVWGHCAYQHLQPVLERLNTGLGAG